MTGMQAKKEVAGGRPMETGPGPMRKMAALTLERLRGIRTAAVRILDALGRTGGTPGNEPTAPERNLETLEGLQGEAGDLVQEVEALVGAIEESL